MGEAKNKPVTATVPAVRAPTIAREILETLAWCVGVAVFLTLLLVSFSDDGAYPFVAGFVMNLIISIAIGFSIHGLFRWVLPRFLERFSGRLGFWLSHLMLVSVAVAVGAEVAIRLIGWLGGPSPAQMRSDVLRIGIVLATSVMAVMVIFERLRQRAQEVERKAERAERETLKARLSALQARTNPHFLFNALNSVAGLIEEDPEAAERALEKMSRLFRYSLDGSKTAWVRLGAELEVVRDYLEMEGLRLGERLRAEVEADRGVEGLLVPPLILQPLVENAVLHAVAPRRAGGRIEVRATRSGSHLSLSVVDDGPGLGNSGHRGTGGSLAELERRLDLVYGEEATLQTGAATGGGCRVAIELPIREAA